MTRSLVALALALLPFAVVAAEIPVAEPGIVLADSATYSRIEPLVVAGGDGFLVVWEEKLFRAYPGPVMVRAYDADGNPRRPFAIAAPLIAHDPKVVWTGSEYLLVGATQLSRFGSTVPLPVVRAMRFRANGTLIEGSEVVLAEGRATAYVASLAWDGDEAIAYFWADGKRFLLRLDANGRVVGDDSVTVAQQAPVAVVTAPRAPRYFLLPEDGDVAAVAPGAVAVVDNTSIGAVVTLLDASLRKIDAFLLGTTSIRSIVWDGSAWLAVYANESSVCTVRFTREADLVRTCANEVSPRSPSIAALHGRAFKAWGRDDEQIVTDSGIASMVTAFQGRPTATRDANGELTVAWIENGRVIVGAPGRAPRTIEESQKARSVGVEGSLLVWTEDGSAWALRLDRRAPPLRLGDAAPSAAIAVASNANGWLVAWEAGAIASTFITANGDPAGVEHFGGPGVTQRTPLIAATPHGFLLAWVEEEMVDGLWRTRAVVEPLDTHGLRVSGGVRLADFLGNYANSTTLSLGCGATRCLAGWGPVDVMPIGFDGQPLGASQRVLDTGTPRIIVSRADGTFDLYGGPFVTSVRADATPIAQRSWTSDSPSVGAVIGTTVVYARSGRVFVRDLATRSRAASH